MLNKEIKNQIDKRISLIINLLELSITVDIVEPFYSSMNITLSKLIN